MLNSLSQSKKIAKWLLTIKKILFITGNALLWGGAWQLDLLAAPAFWHFEEWTLKYPITPFYLPFNIPMDKTLAYCMFWVWIFVGAYLMSLPFYLMSDLEKKELTTSLKAIPSKAKKTASKVRYLI